MRRPPGSPATSSIWPPTSPRSRSPPTSRPQSSRTPGRSSTGRTGRASACCFRSPAKTGCSTGRPATANPRPKACTGMPEPVGDLLGPIAINDVDLIVIPAAAVDATGMRMGWGRGYFDKTLGSMEKCPPVYAVRVRCRTRRRGSPRETRPARRRRGHPDTDRAVLVSVRARRARRRPAYTPESRG